MQPTLQMRDVWTVADLEALDVEDWRRYEIVDGSLLVSPSPDRLHEFVGAQVRAALQAALPPGLLVLGPLGVRIGASYLIPDLVVAERAAMRLTGPLAPAEVFVAIEVVSPGSITTDRVLKPAKYAATGIGHFWRVETDPAGVTVYELPAGGDTYREVGTWTPGQVARIERPFEVTVDLRTLVP
ncbi:MAG: Uma2 family endonuclease [Jatrophihabitans sp.]|nr:MAG: Uma2 family endonuclease [Jatrophihabitans sp.]